MMDMKSPPHPGVLVKQDIKALGYSIVEAAKCLGISKYQLQKIIKGERGITGEMAYRLEKAMDKDADYWLNLQIEYDLAQVYLRADEIKVKRIDWKAARGELYERA